VTLSAGKSLTVSSGTLAVSGAITVPAGSNVTVGGGTLTFSTLTVDNAAGLKLSGGTIDGALSATASTVLTNAGTSYGASTSGGLTLDGSNLSLVQSTTTTNLQGTLAIGSDTYDLDGTSIDASTSGTPLITVGTAGTLENTGSSGGLVEPAVDSTGSIINDATANLQLDNPNTVQTDDLQGLLQTQESGAIELGGSEPNTFNVTGSLTADNSTFNGGPIETTGTNPALQFDTSPFVSRPHSVVTRVRRDGRKRGRSAHDRLRSDHR
jgi:hypothetical protein